MTISRERQEELREYQQALLHAKRYQEIIKNQKIVTFKPLPKGDQSRFFASQNDRGRLVLGGNRSGKTTVGFIESVAHSLGYRPWLAKDDPLRQVRITGGRPIPVPNIGRIIAQDFEQAINQTIMNEKFAEWAPKALVAKIGKNTRQIPTSIHWKNGSIIYLLSNDQKDMSFEGSSGDWFWFDEPIDYRKFTALSRGLVDRDGHWWGTMTPLSQEWINDVIVSKVGNEGSLMSLFKFFIWDNCDEFGGHLSRRSIESFLSDLREDEMEARLYGNFLHLAGLVYKEWLPQTPFWVSPREIPESWPRVCVVDPHSRKPMAMMWAALSPSEVWHVYRAIEDRNIITVGDAAARIMQVEGWQNAQNPGPNAEPVVLRIIDWSAEEEERTSGTSIRAKFGQISPFLAHVKAKKHDAQYGYDEIHEALKIRREWDGPSLVVHSNCEPVKENFMNFVFDEWGSNRQRDRMGEKQSYRKSHDDFIDCIRYLFQHRLTYPMLRRMMVQSGNEIDRLQFEDDRGVGTIFSRDGTRTGIGGSYHG